MGSYGGYIVNPRFLLLACVSLLASCSSDPDPDPAVDPCEIKPVVAGGSVELGLGSRFTPVMGGESINLQLGAQGLWMFVVTGRVRDMEVGSGDLEGVVEAAVLDQAGQQISLELGCRLREFAAADDGYLHFTSPFLVPLGPAAMLGPDGAMVTLHLEVRDTAGRRATDDRSVLAHIPPQ